MEKYNELENLLSVLDASLATYPHAWLTLLEATRKAINRAHDRGELDDREWRALLDRAARIQDRKWLASHRS